MATDFNNAPTEPDIFPPGGPGGAPLGSTVPYPPNAGPQATQFMSPDPTVAYPGPIYTPPGQNLPPTQTQLPQWPTPGAPHGPGGSNAQQARPAPIAPAPYQPPVSAPPVPVRRPYQAPISAPAPRPVKPTRRVPAISAPPPAPYAPAPAAPLGRGWLRLPPLPHLMVGAGLLLMFIALTIPWGAASDGTLIYPQSFTLPYLSDNAPQLAAQVAQNLVSAAAAFSLLLVGVNYFLKLINYLARSAGCAFTILLMPAIILMAIILIGVDVGALVFGVFDPVASVPAWPWQSGFSLNGAHDELGYYFWYIGAVLNLAGGASQPFVRRHAP